MKKEEGVQIVYALPGRVRIKLELLKQDASYAEKIQRDLPKVSGITFIEANPLTGSLVIEYDPSVVEVLNFHSSISSSLGLSPPSNNKKLEKELTEAKGRIKTLESEREELRTTFKEFNYPKERALRVGQKEDKKPVGIR